MSRERRSTVGRLRDWSVSTILVVITLACLAWIAPSLLGYERYVITGGSMAGTIDKGSLVLEKPVPTDELQVGDVITYQPPPGAGTTDLVTHRIVRITQDDKGRQVLRTKGDANTDIDPWRFRLQQPTQPVVEHSIPYAGHALIALADRQTRMLLIGGPAGLVALLALIDLIKALGRRGSQQTAPVPAPMLPSQRPGEPDGQRQPVAAGTRTA